MKRILLLFFLILCLVSLPNAQSQQSEETKTFFAFSLRAAETRLRQDPVPDLEMVLAVGHITRLTGLIVDPATKECIIVGENEPSLPKLHLQDWVVMLRSVFLHHDKEAPGVTIDPPEQPDQPQKVRFFGHIAGTRAGYICFKSDLLLKVIGLSLVPGRVSGLRTYWEVAVEQARSAKEENTKVLSRFWYFPLMARVVNVGNGVLLDRCELAVLTEVLSASVEGQAVADLDKFYDQPATVFAQSFSENFDELARAWPVIADLRSLSAQAALCRGLAKTEVRPELGYWLREFQVDPVEIPSEVPVLRQVKEDVRLVVEGGVQLEAVSLRLKNGDLTGFTDAVLQSRPFPTALVWSFKLTPDKTILIPRPGQSLEVTSASQAYARGRHLFSGRKYDLAIACWFQVARTYPEMGEIYQWIGQAFERKGLPNCAAEYYTKAMKLDPFLANLSQWNQRSGASPKDSTNQKPTNN